MGSLLERLETGGESRLFVHCVTSLPCYGALAKVDKERYPERALLLARPQDIVCVSEEVDPAYLEYLAELGLGLSPDRVVPASRFSPAQPGRPLWARLRGSTEALRALGVLLQKAGPVRLHPYVVSQGQFALAAALEVAAGREVRVAGGDPAVVEYADQKHHVRARAIELGIPVARGEVVELSVAGGRRRGDYDLIRAAVQRHLGPTGRVIVRGAVGASGSCTYVVGAGGEDADGLIRRLEQRTDNRFYLIEEMVPVTLSPNVQLHVEPDGGAITCVGVTDQRWERPLVHGGNLYPSAARTVDQMVGWSHRLARWLQGQGYAGLLGLDFVEYLDPESGNPRSFLAEVNPRVNGATYPLAVFERLNTRQRQAGRPLSGAFVSGTIETRHRSFTAWRETAEPLLYSPARGSGVVPYNLGGMRQGKCGVVVLGSTRDEVLRAYGELQTWCRREGA
jgi:hypothetical protein